MLIWVGRLLLLTAGCGSAFLGGTLLAAVYPSEVATEPLVEKLFRLLPQPDPFRVTLPSDILFNDSQSLLRSGAQPILDSILPELQPYQKATIRIAAHTDDIGNSRDNSELSLRQALAIRQYLASRVKEGYHWVILGYGSSYPLTENTSNSNRQRNRRIEITIEPD
ncbi:hypothetical protein BST81_03060 [Leptolyngbya sp. 'hensonii']|nr:hypothetical protein BST81_03060 [Leptolyngbya sp. 'hensonii']